MIAALLHGLTASPAPAEEGPDRALNRTEKGKHRWTEFVGGRIIHSVSTVGGGRGGGANAGGGAELEDPNDDGHAAADDAKYLSPSIPSSQTILALSAFRSSTKSRGVCICRYIAGDHTGIGAPRSGRRGRICTRGYFPAPSMGLGM